MLIVSNTLSTMRVYLFSIYPGIVIVDEAQSLNNPSTNISYLVKKMKSKMNILVTGTPFSNKIDELLNQLSIVSPDLFSPNIKISME